MPQIELTWIEKHRFLGIDSTNHTVVLSGGNDIGVKPSEALLIALAGCAAYDVVDIIHKQRVVLSRLNVLVRGEQAPDPPRAYRSIHLHFIAHATGLRQEQLARNVDLALNKYCTVRASLSPDIVVTFEAEVMPES